MVQLPSIPLEKLLDYPAPFIFRVIAEARPGLGAECLESILPHLSHSVKDPVITPSKRGKWVSVRLETQVASADEIRSAYAALKAISGVKMLL